MIDSPKALPVINDDNRQYWEYCKKHELRMQKCTTCGHIRFPPGFICPACHSLEAEWTILSGKGIVYSYIIYRAVYHPAFKDKIPYMVAIIQLAEGPRMESNITGCRVEEVKIDMPVEVYFEDVGENISVPKFKPAV
jgi:uncharacterized OB-fold protein